MTDYTISRIERQQAQARADRVTSQRWEEPKPVEKKKEPVQAEAPQDQNSQSMSARLAAFRVQFQVDPKTSDVVILIKDQDTDKIVRTIPADAIKDLPPGQLLDVFS